MFIEMESFMNLNKLETLDLSSNIELVSIEANLFLGLNKLNNLYLESLDKDLIFHNASFNYLTNIGNVYLDNFGIIEKYQCLLMNSIEHDVKRRVGEKYKFFKSFNLIMKAQENRSAKSDCYLKFCLLQFKIHFNLKSDYENELFFEKCNENILIKENLYEYTLMRCGRTFDKSRLDEYESSGKKTMNKIEVKGANTDYLMYLTYMLILSLIGPVFFLILCHLVYSKNVEQNIDEIGKFKDEINQFD